jgi:hypothetical protein
LRIAPALLAPAFLVLVGLLAAPAPAQTRGAALTEDFAAICLDTLGRDAAAAADAAAARGFDTRPAPREEIGALVADASRRFLGGNEVMDGTREAFVGETAERYARGRRLRVESGRAVAPDAGLVPVRGCRVEARAVEAQAPAPETVLAAMEEAVRLRLGGVEGPASGDPDRTAVWTWSVPGRSPRVIDVAYRPGGGFVSVDAVVHELTREAP